MRSQIAATASALREAGFVVQVVVDSAVDDQEDAERRRDARAEARADRLADRASRHAEASEVHDRRSRAISAGIPLGQPILQGHHSQRRHERDLERLRRHDRQAAEHAALARESQRRADIAAAAADHRNAPIVVANRIERLAAQVRQDECTKAQLVDAGRTDTDYWLTVTERLEHTAAELEHWRRVRAQQITDGVATDYGPDTVVAGDAVRIRNQWHRVVRANRATVSVETGYSWTAKSPWHEVQDHRSAADLEAAADRSAAKEQP